MDIDDLFGSFNSEEKGGKVDSARVDQRQHAGKRKTPGEDSRDGTVGVGNKRRQTAPTTEGDIPASGANTEHVVGGRVGVAKREEISSLKEGRESSTVREDGTLVKSVRLYKACRLLTIPDNHNFPVTLHNLLKGIVRYDIV